jgi:2-dehydropantoate 2-reductase
MRVLVYGAGGVGLGLGSFLLGADVRVHFVGRSETVSALRVHGLSRSGRFGSAHAPPDSFEATHSVDELRPCDFVLVAVKTTDNDTAAAELAASLPDEPPLVLCQNGWGNAERFAKSFPEARIWNARVITGFARPVPHRVDVTAHAEPVAIGSVFGRDPAPIEPLCEALRRGGLPTEATTGIAEVLWAKLLYNGCLNALGAILGVPYGSLADSADSRGIIAELASEIFAVMHAAGHATRWSDAESYLSCLYGELLPPTQAHESSTLQDLRAGKRTEIDAINGAIVDLGARLGIETPVNRTLCALIRSLEERGSR